MFEFYLFLLLILLLLIFCTLVDNTLTLRIQIQVYISKFQYKKTSELLYLSLPQNVKTSRPPSDFYNSRLPY